MERVNCCNYEVVDRMAFVQSGPRIGTQCHSTAQPCAIVNYSNMVTSNRFGMTRMVPIVSS